MRKTFLTVLFILFLHNNSYSQIPFKWETKDINPKFANLYDTIANTLQNSDALLPLFQKLYAIKQYNNQNVVFVHLGDSHIQADMETSFIRKEFQIFFGNAGRGLIFPYQLAKSNAPWDIITNSKSNWNGNRITKPENNIPCGIAGFGLKSTSINPDFNFEFRLIDGIKDSFDKVDLFFEGKLTHLLLETADNLYNESFTDSISKFTSFNLSSATSQFKLQFMTNDTINFYGANLQKKNTPGIIYHSIGANGAKYSDYNKTPIFWQQLNKLQADCYIISLGTNEAQDLNLNIETYVLEINTMVKNILSVSPEANIIITSPPVSYYKKKFPNKELELISNTISNYCKENNLVFWDLYSILKGSMGAKKWRYLQLLRPDLVHFSREGYELQGNLFVKVFEKSWNLYIKTVNK